MALIVNENLRSIIAGQIESLGYSLWGIELVPRRYSYLARIYIDRQGSEPLGIDDCARVNRALDACLQEEKMDLEVSTPGLARKLFDIEQYAAYIGEKVKIKTKKLINGQKNFSGELLSCDEGNLSLAMAGDVRNFSHKDILIGQLEPNYQEIFRK